MLKEEAIKIFEDKLNFARKEYSDVAKEYIEALEMAINILKESERLHGQWIHTGLTNIYGGHQHKCSVCGYQLMVSPMCDNENYCCNCGAIMDEENKC